MSAAVVPSPWRSENLDSMQLYTLGDAKDMAANGASYVCSMSCIVLLVFAVNQTDFMHRTSLEIRVIDIDTSVKYIHMDPLTRRNKREEVG